MATNYRKSLVEMAIDLVGSSIPATNQIFMESYNKWASKRSDSNSSTPPSAVFITYIARMCGVPVAIIPNISSVDGFLDWVDGNARLRTPSDKYTPRPGDLVLIENHDDKQIGIYLGLLGDKIDYVDGGLQGDSFQIQRHSRLAVSGTIAGYIVPDYDWKESKGMINWTQLSSLVKPLRIQEFRDWLIKTYGIEFIERFVAGTPEGVFSPGWYRVAIAAWQKSMHFVDEDVNGEFEGPFCKMAADENPIKVASRGNKSMILIGMLYVKGYDPKGWTTRFGSNGEESLKAFQKARSLKITGEADYDTLCALFRS